MRNFKIALLAGLGILSACQDEKKPVAQEQQVEVEFIAGKEEYLTSPFVTSGKRLYLVGHQDGSFPELGWHIKDEMGGLWDQPIKLLDGFEAELTLNSERVKLDKATKFLSYPYKSEHLYTFNKIGLKVVREQFVPENLEGLIVTYRLKNISSEAVDLEFAFKPSFDLRPTWLAEEKGITDGKDQLKWDDVSQYFVANDSINPWFSIVGANMHVSNTTSAASSYKGNGTTGTLSLNLNLKAGEAKPITFYVSGSYKSLEAAQATYLKLKEDKDQLYKSKQELYTDLKNRTVLRIPDADVQQAFTWLKYNSNWLVQEVPEIGTGIVAGIPDYPWWFGVDSEYALQGYLAIGQYDPVISTVKLLDSMSNVVNGNGRIIHEMSTNGVVFNKGNINETPQFASLIWEIYNWTGDKRVLESYFPTIKKGLAWLMDENDSNNNQFPDGFGMMEIHGMDSEMIDVAAYSQKAFKDAAQIALVFGETELAKSYQDQADLLKDKINTEFWSEESNSYADFIGTDKQALRLIDDAIVRADTLDKPWAVAELRQTKEYLKANPSSESRPFVLHHNWVVNTPMEVGLADTALAQRALKTAEKFVNPFGVFVTGIDRDETSGSDEGSFKGSSSFSYTGAVMTLPTSVLAIAENNYGNPDKALDYIKRMTRSFSYAFPGSMYEVSPDYGMITQAWTIYGYAIPIVKQFFGVNPKAGEKTIVIKPQMPSSWDNVALENLRIADNQLSMTYQEDANGIRLAIKQSKPDWKLHIQLPATASAQLNIEKGDAVIEKDTKGNVLNIKASGPELIMMLSK